MKKRPLKKDFLIEVIAEINAIKSKAKAYEINKLNFENFNHDSANKCIYGQMTGSCSSDRAYELSPKKYCYIGGNNFKDQNFEQGINRFTALEKYLFMVKTPMHKKIIAYLKNEIDTLVLK